MLVGFVKVDIIKPSLAGFNLFYFIVKYNIPLGISIILYNTFNFEQFFSGLLIFIIGKEDKRYLFNLNGYIILRGVINLDKMKRF